MISCSLTWMKNSEYIFAFIRALLKTKFIQLLLAHCMLKLSYCVFLLVISSNVSYTHTYTRTLSATQILTDTWIYYSVVTTSNSTIVRSCETDTELNHEYNTAVDIIQSKYSNLMTLSRFHWPKGRWIDVSTYQLHWTKMADNVVGNSLTACVTCIKTLHIKSNIRINKY